MKNRYMTPVQSFAFGGIANPVQRAMLRGSDKEFLDARQKELDDFEAQRQTYNTALQDWQTNVYQPYQQQTTAYNTAAQQYNTEIFNPYQTQYDAYMKAVEAYNTGPRTEDYSGPAAPSLSRPFEMQAPIAPTDFSMSAPVLPFKEEEVQKFQQEAAGRARTDAAGRALAIDVVSNPDQFNFGSMSVANRFMAKGGPVEKTAREQLNQMSVPKFAAGGPVSREEAMFAPPSGSFVAPPVHPDGNVYGVPTSSDGKWFYSDGKWQPNEVVQPFSTSLSGSTGLSAPASAADFLSQIANTPGMGSGGIGVNIQPLPASFSGSTGLTASGSTGLTASGSTGLTASEPTGLTASEPTGLTAREPVGLTAREPVGLTAREPVGLTAREPDMSWMTVQQAPVVSPPPPPPPPPAPVIQPRVTTLPMQDVIANRSILASLPGTDLTSVSEYSGVLPTSYSSLLPTSPVAWDGTAPRPTVPRTSSSSGTTVPGPGSETPPDPVILPSLMDYTSRGVGAIGDVGGIRVQGPAMPVFGNERLSGGAATDPNSYFAMMPQNSTGLAPGSAAIGPADMPIAAGRNTLAAIAANPNLSPTMLGGQQNAGMYTDRMGNRIYAPGMGSLYGFAKGGDVDVNALLAQNAETLSDEEPEEVINTNPVGTAQQMLADLAGAERASPTRMSVKRTKTATGGGASADKSMRMGTESLAKGDLGAMRDTAPAKGAPDSARSQMEELARVYQTRMTAARNKARGLSADTFGAPTLEGPSLTKNTLAKKRFNKGGEAKKSEGDAAPKVTGVNKVLDFIAQRLPADVFPTSGRTLLETVQGAKTPITEKNFSPEEMDVMRELAALKGGDKGSISYADYVALAREMNKRGEVPASMSPSLFSMADPMGNVQTTLGQFRYMKDPQGNLQVVDKYDFNPPNPNAMQEARTGDYGAFGPYGLIRDYAGEKVPPGAGREVRVNLGPVKKRAEGSPEEGEVSQAELDAASRPAFVSPNMPKATKISRANDPTDRIMGVIEPAVTLGTGAVAAAVGMPRGIYKGLTSGKFKEGKAASIASKEAADFIERNTYVPRSESGKENLAALNKIAEDLKLAPAPGGAAMASLARPTAVRAQGANIADDFQQYNQQISVPGASYAVPPQGPAKTPAPASGLGFYSAAEQAALNLPRKEGSGAAFLNDLMKAPDVKKEELSAMGLDEFLRGKPKATRQEVQDFIANNRIDVKEVQFGNIRDQATKKEQEAAGKLVNLINAQDGASIRLEGTQGKVFSDEALYALQDGTTAPGQFPVEFQGAASSYLKAYEAAKNASNTKTKFDTYQLPGGENYREILLTLPKQSPNVDPSDVKVLATGTNKVGGKPFVSFEFKGERYVVEKTASETDQQAISRRIEAIPGVSDANTFRSSHFDEPNILAHMRVNDRVDADGKKMLLIEELQSDWHQAGREKGYRGNEQKTPYDDPAYVQARERAMELGNEFNRNNHRPDRQAEIEPMLREARRVERSFTDRNNRIGNQVPDAPFKDTWHQLALKRALKYAADNGYERVGLTTGKQQSQRYNLGTQVDHISYEPTKKGFYINVISKDGPNVLNGDYSAKELEGIVGKELTQKMLAKQGKNEFNPEIEPDLAEVRRLDGVDLQLEDKGMKKYYDEIYPTFLAKQAKKYGAQVGETRIKTGNAYAQTKGIPAEQPVRYIDIAPGMQDAVPYAKGGAVDKNTAFIQAHS
jgi:hypothetical protein